jgi:anti-anti-sigma factor
MKPTTFLLDRTGLDDQTASAVADYLTSLAYDQGPVKIHLDFRRVEWLGSAAVGTLIGLNRRIVEGKGRLVLDNVNDTVADVLRLTRLDKVLEIRPTAA